MADHRRCAIFALLCTFLKKVEIGDEFVADNLEVLQRLIPFTVELPRSIDPKRKQDAENDNHPFNEEVKKKVFTFSGI